jgi:hypothetical protein
MKPEGSLTCLQETSASPHAEATESSPQLHVLFI